MLRTEAEDLLAPLIKALEGERELLRTVWPHAKALLADDKLQRLTQIGTSLGAGLPLPLIPAKAGIQNFAG